LPDQDHYKHNAKRCFTLLQFGAASGGGRSSAGPAIIIIMMMIMMSMMMMGIGEESTRKTRHTPGLIGSSGLHKQIQR